MLYILFAIFCSVCVSILLKLARRYEVNLPQAVMWNYLTASILCLLIFKPSLATLNLAEAPLFIFGSVSVLLPVLFIIFGKSVFYSGIVRTDLAQRLSVFIPIVAAILFMGEDVFVGKLIGVLLAIVAILMSIPWGKSTAAHTGYKVWGYLLTVFVGMGAIDILFKQVANYKTIPYSASLFLIFMGAFVVCVIRYIYVRFFRKTPLRIQHLVAGVILGCFNFGNILFYLKAHQSLSANPILVFAVMNVGVIVLGAIVGLFIFKEKLSSLNKFGIVVAVLAIVILTYYK